jgi:hypothetical protein
MSWKRACLLSLLACGWLLYRDCTRKRPANPAPPGVAECERILSAEPSITITRHDETERPALADTKPGGGFSAYGFHVPAWAVRLAPQPGENLMAYRDRMLPLVQTAIAPHRTRVARGREDFATAVGLDAHQRTELDAAVQDAASQIQERVLEAAFSGELSPRSFKPMTGVTLARDVLDTVERANRRFVASLREDQREHLARHPFDVADYLVFATRWEDVFGISGR